jgi:hypothetical protein
LADVRLFIGIAFARQASSNCRQADNPIYAGGSRTPSNFSDNAQERTQAAAENHLIPNILSMLLHFSEHHGREWPTNKTGDIYLSAINLQRSPFNTCDMRLFPRSMEAFGGPQMRC